MKRRNGKLRKTKIDTHKRWKMGKVTLVLIMTLITSTAHAFTFDVWESGMDVDTMIMTAMKNDIPLRKAGWIGNTKHFDKRLCVPYRATATAYDYITELFGKTAKVTLHLTKREKRLMKASIQWGQGGEVFDIVKKIVKNKKPISKKIKSRLFIKKTSYRIDDETEIDLTMTSNILTMDYKDLRLMAHDANTKQHKKKIKKNNAIIKDAGKF